MIDYTHIMKDAGLVAASAAAQVDSVDKIENLGAGMVEGKLVVDVTAIEIASNDEAYRIAVQGSSKSDFADTIEELAAVELGRPKCWAAIRIPPLVDTRCLLEPRKTAPYTPISVFTPKLLELLPQGSIILPIWQNKISIR